MLYLSIHPALTPGPIQNITSDVDTLIPSVMLKWDPPANAGYPGYVTKYRICFLDSENVCYGMKVVNGCTTTTVIRGVMESSKTSSSIKVMAYSGENVSQECILSDLPFAGMYIHIQMFWIYVIFC